MDCKILPFLGLPFYNFFAGVELEPVTAILSSTHTNVHVGASKCIDGNTEGPDEGFHHGARADYCLTQNEPLPWIAIDYGTTVTVQKVEIFNRRAERFKLRTRNIFVRISDELPTSGNLMFSGGTLLGNFAGTAAVGQHITISGKQSPRKLLKNVPGQPKSGRFVIVQMDNGLDMPLNLKEVKSSGFLILHNPLMSNIFI